MYKRSTNSFRIIRKSRSTHPEIGAAMDTLYRAYSGTTYPNLTPWILRKEPKSALEFYNASKGLRGTNISIPVFYGTEELVERRYGRGKMNDVLHRKSRYVNRPFLLMWKPSSGYTYYNDYHRVKTTRNLAYSALAEHLQYCTARFRPGNDSQFSARAFWSMRPKFQGEISLVNSVFELKDFKDVLKPLKVAKLFKSAVSKPLYSDYKKSFIRMAKDENVLAKVDEYGLSHPGDLSVPELKAVARDLSGSAAAAVLTYNLAIKPTIADVLGIVAQLQTAAMDAQKAFAASGDDGSLSHFSEHYHTMNTLVPGTGNYNVYGTGAFAEIKRTATMRSFYAYKMRDLNQTLVRYWGLAGTIEALWNMLPLSFVLDYVFTIGKALQFMARDNNVTSLATEYCESVSIKLGDGIAVIQDPRVVSLIIDGVYQKPVSGPKYHLVSGTEVTRYERAAMDAYKGPALPVFKVPKTSQALNLLALARCMIF